MVAKKYFYVLSIIALGFALSGCFGVELALLGAQAVSMTPEKKPAEITPEQQQKVLPANYSITWKSLVDSIKELDLPIINANKQDGQLITDYMPIKKEVFGKQILFAGFAERVDTGRYKLNISLENLSDRTTKVRVKPIIEKYVQYPHSSSVKPQWKIEDSTGVIENVIFQKINEKISGKK